MTKYGYARLSKENKKNITIQAQTDRLKALGIAENNIHIDDGRSAGIKEDMITFQYNGREFRITIDLQSRPSFRQLMDIMQKGDELHFTKWDRLSRNGAFLEYFVKWTEQKGIKLCPMDDDTNPLVRRILTVIAENEVDKTQKRNDDVSKSVYDNGGFPYKAPIGYIKNSKNDNGTLRYPEHPEYCLIVDSEKVAMVKDIFQRMAQGEYYQDICDKHTISGQTLYNIVRNRTYLGETHYADQWKPSDLIPAIINQETFNKANKNIKTKT